MTFPTVFIQRPNMVMSVFCFFSFLREEGKISFLSDAICSCVYMLMYMRVFACECLCVGMYLYVCVFSRVSTLCVSTAGRCCGSGLRSGLNSPAQTLTGWEDLQCPLVLFLPRSSLHSSLGLRHRPKFPRFPAGRWGLLAPFGSAGSFWETQGASGAQMPPSLGSRSAMIVLRIILRTSHLLILWPLLSSAPFSRMVLLLCVPAHPDGFSL